MDWLSNGGPTSSDSDYAHNNISQLRSPKFRLSSDTMSDTPVLTMNRFLVCPFSAEFELESEGNSIPDPDFGFKLTAQSLLQWRATRRRDREPLLIPPPELHVSRERPADTLPRLLFGFPLRWQHVIDYAKRRKLKLLDETKSDPVYRKSHAALVAIADLDRRCGADLRYEFPRLDDYDFMVSLYTNITLDEDELEPQGEKQVIEFIQRELRLSGPQKWYWDPASK
ncbi:hypothetical protein EVG20_g7180 [Dentipellis fragilis]|uniref:Uncharacterized protein n=1 Tax=Dentipellis fragilis TaxID=205917 RepID=A0A4Y9YFZ4_9AGAM|nr:hypothetical protein EVG20_g7180 [Dentipellis fragilis]